jgi:hypothetical protein
VKAQLSYGFHKILKLIFVSFLDFGNFERYSEKFSATAYDSLLKLYRWCFNSLLIKTELSVLYIYKYLPVESNISDLKYLITSYLSMALPEVTKFSTLLLTIQTTSSSVKRPVSALKRSSTYLCSTQTQESLTKFSLIIEKKFFKT